MKTKKEINKKIKEAQKEMISLSGGVFSYWLGYQRALEWILIKDETNEKKNINLSVGNSTSSNGRGKL